MAIFKIEMVVVNSTEEEQIKEGIVTLEHFQKLFQDFISKRSSEEDKRYDSVMEIELTREEWKKVLGTLPNEQEDIFLKDDHLCISDKCNTIILKKDNKVYLNEVISEEHIWKCEYINEDIVKIIKKLVKPTYDYYEPTLNPLILYFTGSKDRITIKMPIVAGIVY